ncbi:MAG: MgtC/SapB family protein [Burkholderiaceae bacterium]
MIEERGLFDLLATELGRSGDMSFSVIAVRLTGAALLCGLIGFEREVVKNSAGLRTTMLIGLAAATYALITLELISTPAVPQDALRVDPVRLVEAVTSGVAFLAAGLIVWAKGHVHGLTTGAGMWLSAAVGVSAGLGLWKIAMLATLAGLIVLAVLKAVQQRMGLKE